MYIVWAKRLHVYPTIFFENQPINEICSHLSEKASKGRFFEPEKLQNHSNEGKGKEKKKGRGEGKEEKKKKAMVELLVFIIATLEFLADNKSTIPSSDVIQLSSTLKMTTAQVVEMSVTVNNNSPIQDYIHPDDQT